MNDIFLYLCNFSVITTVVIAISVLLRPLLKKGPSFIRCILWALIFLRLMIPVSFVGDVFSAPSLFSAYETEVKPTVSIDTNINTDSQESAVTVVPPTVDTNIGSKPTQDTFKPPVLDNNNAGSILTPPFESITDTEDREDEAPVIKPSVEDTATNNSNTVLEENETKSDTVLPVLATVWLAGVAVMLIYVLVSHIALRYRIKDAVVYDSRIRILSTNCSPFVMGLIRPIIYIPASIDKNDWHYIIAHEESHIKRLDHILKPISFLVLCVYWMNPLLWVAYALFSKDIEYACDEKTTSKMAHDERRAYSLALLSGSANAKIVFAHPLAFGKVNVKERIKRVMNYKRSLLAICLTLIICISLVAVVACTPSVTPSGPLDETSEDSSADSSEDEVDVEFTVEEVSDDEFYDYISVDAIYPPLALNPPLITPDFAPQPRRIKISANKTVKNFKLVRYVGSSADTSSAITLPYEANALIELDELTPDKPVYAIIYPYSVANVVGFSYSGSNGKTHYLSIFSVCEIGKEDRFYIEPIDSEAISAFHEVELKVVLSYINPDDLDENASLFDDGGSRLIMISVNKPIKNFKFINVLYDEDTEPYAGEALFEIDMLAPRKHFYAKTDINEGLSIRGISYTDGDENRYLRITRKSESSIGATTYLEEIKGNEAAPDNSSKLEISLDKAYFDDAEMDFIEEGYEPPIGYHSIKISTNKTVKDFKYICVLQGNNGVLYAGDTLYETDSLTPDDPFCAKTITDKRMSHRGISYTNSNGKTCYALIAVTEKDERYLKPFVVEENAIETTIFVPAKTEDMFNSKEVTFDGSPKGIVSALVSAGVLPEGTIVNSFYMVNGTAHIDLNQTYYDYINKDEYSRYYGLGCLVKSILKYYNKYGVEMVMITVNCESLNAIKYCKLLTFDNFEGKEHVTDGKNYYAALSLFDINAIDYYPYPVSFDGTPEGLITALVEASGWNQEIKMNSFTIKDRVAYIDMNKAFGDYVGMGHMAISGLDCVADTLLNYYGGTEIDKVDLKIEGEYFVSDHM